MNIEELMQFVEVKEGKEEELAGYLQDKMVTAGNVKKYLEKAITSDPTTEERRTIQPYLDKYHERGLETWKKNHLDSLIDEEVSKRHPAETEDQKRIRKLEQKLQEAEAKERQVRLKSYAADIGAQKGLPTELISFFVGEDETATEANIDLLHRIAGDWVDTTVKARFRDTGRNVPLSRQPGAASVDKLREQYQKAVETNMPLQARVKLSRQIQELEQQKE